jgi:hypothetical protein
LLLPYLKVRGGGFPHGTTTLKRCDSARLRCSEGRRGARNPQTRLLRLTSLAREAGLAERPWLPQVSASVDSLFDGPFLQPNRKRRRPSSSSDAPFAVSQRSAHLHAWRSTGPVLSYTPRRTGNLFPYGGVDDRDLGRGHVAMGREQEA